MPFATASSASSCPTWCRSSVSQVAPRAVEHGKHAAGTPLKKRVPRTPLGPSEVRREGMSSRFMAAVCQKSVPGVVSWAKWELWGW